MDLKDEEYNPEWLRKEIIKYVAKGLIAPIALIKLGRDIYEHQNNIKKAAGNVLEEGSDSKLNFNQVKNMLMGAGLDLEKERKRTVIRHYGWGLVKELRRKGMILNTDQYGGLFDNVKFTRKGIDELIQKLTAREKWIPVFNPGFFTYSELWKTIIAREKIQYWKNSYCMQHMDKMRMIGPESVPGLEGLHNAPAHEQKDAFIYAYNSAEEIKLAGPKIYFIRDIREVENTNKSAVQMLQAASRGVHYMDPGSDLIRWRTQFEDTGQHPDLQKTTQYPFCVYPNGNVPYLYWVPVSGRLTLQNCEPAYSANTMGARQVLF